jgi:hypothetical protein
MAFKNSACSIQVPVVKSERIILAENLTAQIKSEMESLSYPQYDMFHKCNTPIAIIKMNLNYCENLAIERIISVLNSYSIKDSLKSNGFYYDPTNYSWNGKMNEKNIELLKSLNVEIYK